MNKENIISIYQYLNFFSILALMIFVTHRPILSVRSKNHILMVWCYVERSLKARVNHVTFHLPAHLPITLLRH